MKLKVITSNPGKVIEYQKAFAKFDVCVEHCCVPYDEIQTSELEEVVKKGMSELRAKGLRNFIIDDSGLFIHVLRGFPGVYSAYCQKTIGNDGILSLMKCVDDRSSTFKCCIGCDIDNKTIIVTGKCDGHILYKETGNNGFGYDPIFTFDGKRSFAEMSIDEKNVVSHRGNAVKLLMSELTSLGLINTNN
ncbi:MAG: RdgB/HAM1 family non-canonical purine NTP pyrophosphatase [archaeon]|nr:RdgB/HAM1 family non-canonical purine NTP pyrophosphatase [archaeon]